MTGGLEVASAAMTALAASCAAGITLGAVIIVVATITILRRRAFSHAAPMGVFAILVALVVAMS